MADAVLDTREVLLEHLAAKVRCINHHFADKVTGLVSAGLSNAQLVALLECDATLDHAAHAALTRLNVDAGEVREVVGPELFQQVAAVEPQLCAQVTGMLLELPVATLCEMLQHPDALRLAVTRARDTYVNHVTGEGEQEAASQEFQQAYTNEATRGHQATTGHEATSSEANRQEVGEVLYARLEATHPPGLAARVTGMLLTADPADLPRLLTDPRLFQHRVTLALQALGEEG